MTVRNSSRDLEFPCECVSAKSGYSDPWAGIAQHNLLKDGTKERVLNSVAREPKTIARLSNELGLSQPTIHAHVSDMLSSGLLRAATEWTKTHPAENFYEPAFPVIKSNDRAVVEPICEALALQVADLFRNALPELERAIQRTGLPASGWDFADLSQYLYCCIHRRARELLEHGGVLPGRERHPNGAEWIFWAEESSDRHT